jgi:hypothetical protein
LHSNRVVARSPLLTHLLFRSVAHRKSSILSVAPWRDCRGDSPTPRRLPEFRQSGREAADDILVRSPRGNKPAAGLLGEELRID